jgi:hypothetical protein
MVDMEVALYDGSYHEVDSSEAAFKIAGSIALQEASRRSGLVLLEPIMKLLFQKFLSSKRQAELATVLITELALILSGSLVISLAIGPWLLPRLYPNLAPESILFGLKGLSLMTVYAVLFLFSNALSQILYATHRYGMAEVRQVIFGLFVISFVIGGWSFAGIHPLLGGYLWGIVAVNVYLLAVMVHARLFASVTRRRYRRIRGILTRFWRKFISLIGVSVLSTLPDYWVQYQLGTFGPQILSAHDFGNRFYLFVSNLVVPALLTPYYTKISHLAAIGQFPLRLSIRLAVGLLLLGAGLAIGLALLGTVSQTRYLMAGQFTEASFTLTRLFFLAYLLGFGVAAVSLQLTYVALAFNLHHIYVANIIVSGIATVCGVLLLRPFLGFLAIPLTVGFSYGIGILLQLIGLRIAFRRKGLVYV